MKKYIYAIVAIAASLSQANAQWYVKAGGGYAFPTAGQTIKSDQLPYQGTAQYDKDKGFTTYKVKPASLASGAQCVLGIGYMLNKNVGVEVGANIGIANTKYTSHNIIPGQSAMVYQSIIVYANAPILLTPSLILQANVGKLDLYTRNGLTLPVSSKIITEETSTYNGGLFNIDYKYSTKFKPGFTGAIGVKCPLTEFLKLWVEGSFISQSLYVKKSEMIRYKIDSQDYLGRISPQDRIVKFEDEMNDDVDVTYSVPFSSIGINVGLDFAL